MCRSITILMIDDCAGDAELLRRALEHIDEYDVDFLHAFDFDEAAELLLEHEIDVVFLDYQLGADTGIGVLERLRQRRLEVPVIALTGLGDAYVARDLMRHGADDFLVKGDMNPEALRGAIERATGRFHRRRLEALTVELSESVQRKNEELQEKNDRLAELYHTAHMFVDDVSHEFRTPLTVIREFTSILNDGLAGEVSPEQHEYLETVLDRVDDLAMMIDDMLDVSKLDVGLVGIRRRACSIAGILDHVGPVLLRKAASNRIAMTLPDDDALPEVFCDPDKIGRVIINLVVNAIKFSPEGSRVSLSTESKPDEGLVRMHVTDSGPGIPPEKVAEVFERFQQVEGGVRSSAKGFGLGLNIVRGLVHQNFGDIDVASRVGKGSTFSFTVPTADPERLIERYLDRISALREKPAHVAAIHATIAESEPPDIRDEVKHFLLDQTHCDDLLLPSGAREWVIFTPSDDDETGLAASLGHAKSAANRNRVGSQLPDIQYDELGRWSVCDERARIVAACRRGAVPTGEPVHV